jgi:anthranilate/para-aminobenzoate synthase component II
MKCSRHVETLQYESVHEPLANKCDVLHLDLIQNSTKAKEPSTLNISPGPKHRVQRAHKILALLADLNYQQKIVKRHKEAIEHTKL